jgi:hypothetical protein
MCWCIAALAMVMVWLLTSQLVKGRRTWARRPSVIWRVCWRVAECVFLLTLVADETRLLGTKRPSDWIAQLNWYATLPSSTARYGFLPVLGSMTLAGLVLGLQARWPRQRVERFVWPDGLSALVAGLAGVLMVATMMTIPLLIMIAIDGSMTARGLSAEGSAHLVTHLPGPIMPPSLGERMDATTPVIGLTTAFCMLAAVWLGTSLRRPTRSVPSKHGYRSWFELGLGIILAALLLALTYRLVVVTLPAMQPHVLEGLSATLGGWELGMIIVAFATFAAGLVAHALAHRSEVAGAVSPPSLMEAWRGIARPIRAGLAGAFIVFLVVRWESWPGLIDHETLWFPALAIPWLAWRLWTFRAASSSPDSPRAPLDRIFDSRGSSCRFLGAWAALTALLIAAVPTLALAGLIVLHRVLGP